MICQSAVGISAIRCTKCTKGVAVLLLKIYNITCVHVPGYVTARNATLAPRRGFILPETLVLDGLGLGSDYVGFPPAVSDVKSHRACHYRCYSGVENACLIRWDSPR